jgi:hypothetical protein
MLFNKKLKTKCGIFSLIRTSIEGVKIIDINAIAGRFVQLYSSISLPLIKDDSPA